MKDSNESSALIRPDGLQERISQIRHFEVGALTETLNQLHTETELTLIRVESWLHMELLHTVCTVYKCAVIKDYVLYTPLYRYQNDDYSNVLAQSFGSNRFYSELV